MGHYLRDQRISNIELDIDSIVSLCGIINERVAEANSKIEKDNAESKLFSYFVIRFDGKGFRVFSIEELKQYYEQATGVERVVITAESKESLGSQRAIGTYIELSLDARNESACTLVASSDDHDWVEASFACIHEALRKYKTNNGLARTAWTPFLFQIFGVLVGFLVSIWGASSVYQHLNVENPFAVSLIFFILMFSNIWTYVYPRGLAFISKLFPSIVFVQRKRPHVHWLYQTLIGSAFFALMVFFLTKIWGAAMIIIGAVVS